jgi:hypothetical protein
VSERVDWVVVGHAWCDNSHNTSDATTQAAEISGDFDAPYPPSHTRLLTGCQTPKAQRYSGGPSQIPGEGDWPTKAHIKLDDDTQHGLLAATVPGRVQ